VIPRRSLAVIFSIAALAAEPARAQRWQIQYFYDQNDSDLTLLNLQFTSPGHGVATGYISQKGKTRPAVVSTEDGGAHWSLAQVKEPGLALFLLDEKLGWMASAKRIWKTLDGGHTWQKQRSLQDVQRLYFLTAQHGWAVAENKKIYETNDGGEKWVEIPAAAEPNSNPDTTTYGWIDFADSKTGVITGWSLRSGADATGAEWMIPETAVARRETPHLSIVLETRDGGVKWTSSTTSLFGRLVRVRLSPKGYGLGLVEFTDAFEWPSEVYRFDWTAGGKSTRVFREKNRFITDVAVLGDGTAYLAGIAKTDKLPNSPIPGKVKVLRSHDLKVWVEMEVDYRATARRTTLAVLDEEHAWMATDTGMILKWTKSP
jgi:photosystem II stability/assembly factor-like uncharacterized protein